jgi:hypothetical protein
VLRETMGSERTHAGIVWRECDRALVTRVSLRLIPLHASRVCVPIVFQIRESGEIRYALHKDVRSLMKSSLVVMPVGTINSRVRRTVAIAFNDRREIRRHRSIRRFKRFRISRVSRFMDRCGRRRPLRLSTCKVVKHLLGRHAREFLFEPYQCLAHDERTICLRPTAAAEEVRQTICGRRFIVVQTDGDYTVRLGRGSRRHLKGSQPVRYIEPSWRL